MKLNDHPLMKKLSDPEIHLTPKGRILGNFVLNNPRKAVFMTIRELARTCNVSEATVVRFVSGVGFGSYGHFQQTLRDLMDTDMPLMERLDIAFSENPDANCFHQEIYKNIENLRQLYDSIDTGDLERVVDCLYESRNIYVIGSRLSYCLAHYMGWGMSKIKGNVHTLNGSDSTCLDILSVSEPGSLVLIFTVSRYPNELLRLGRHVRRVGHKLVVISDNALAPLNSFANLNLAAPTRFIPLFSNPISMMSLVNYLLTELAGRYGKDLDVYQQKLEQTYRENDILFNPDKL